MTIPDENYTTTPTIPAQAALEFLHDVRQLVAFHQAIGIEGYPRTPELAQFLAGPQPPASSARPQTKAAAKPETIRTPSARTQTAAAVMPDTTLSDLYAEIQGCQRCPHHQSRSKAITGESTTGIKLLIITDGPSAEDDRSGLIMSGEPGQLLDKMLGAIGLNRADVHLSLLTRCHAPEPPGKEAVDACLPFLLKEIMLVAPTVICAMGVLAAQKLLHTSKPLSQLRGRFHDFQGIPLIPTFSPEFLLKNPEMKKATWLDLQMIQKKIQVA
ncbi:MAG: uracil-DNA glycosylase [Proteobacteria bacterium]|nr:uracil-DNA glycosylase [Pseudomonadota bacterium]MCG2824158.1 uracil-DNA glycosylase [Desulfobulbaceae bacterium]MDP2003897.1 uracil-DNA glycosylase [Desulfurivibrionaceae bacterium]